MFTESYFSWVHEAYTGRGHAAMGSGCGEADGVLSCCCEGRGCREADGARTRCDRYWIEAQDPVGDSESLWPLSSGRSVVW